MRTLWLAAIGITAVAMANPVHLRCEHLENPLGIDSAHPRFAWQSDSTERGWRQTAYQLVVSSTAAGAAQGKGDIWDSGRQSSAESVGIAYAGPALAPKTRYYWTLRVWDANGKQSPLAAPAWFETGLMSKENWTAKWILRGNLEESADRAAMPWIWAAGQNALNVPPKTTVAFRRAFEITGSPGSVVLLVAGHGDLSVKLNGRVAGGKKSWTAPDRLDLTPFVKAGQNTIEATVFVPEVPTFGGPPDGKMKGGFAAVVKVTATDGSVTRYGTTDGWSADGRPAVGVGTGLGEVGLLPQPASMFRRDFTVRRPVKSARLYATALGSYRFLVNGESPANAVLTPEFSEYRRRVFYQTYDVTKLLRDQANTLTATLGDGWYASPLTWTGEHFYTGLGPVRFMGQLEIRYTDGTSEVVNTDDSWTTAASPIVYSTIYGGEAYDARLEQSGWAKPGFRGGSGWAKAIVGAAPNIEITAQVTPPVAVVDTIAAKSVKSFPRGAAVYDMGQNMVGWVTLKARGPAGSRVQLRFAEILNPDRTIYRDNLRNADATDLYVLRGTPGGEAFTPAFTFHGFRYVEVTGLGAAPELSAITGRVVSSLSGPPTARITTSSDLVNRFWKIGIWGQRGNFLSVPTDCPQRDERLGWTGDAGVFWRTGAYNFDTAAFTRKFMLDMIDSQTAEGAFPNTAPDLLDREHRAVGAPGWGDAGVLVPWNTWQQYGDRRFIDDNWDAMERWMAFIEGGNPAFLRKDRVGPNFADWLAPDERSPKDLIATAYWALMADMMTDMARATGRTEAAAKYARLLENIRGAYQKAFVKPDGEVAGGTQTAYLLTLYTKMAPPALTGTITAKLLQEIHARNDHVSTGFLGTPFLLFTLSQAYPPRNELAYKLLLNDTYPSWGYMLSKGATTWWERWNGDTGDPAMNSYNHYAFGSVMAWVYRSAAAIDTDPAQPGFRRILIRPALSLQMNHARTEYDSVYGKIVTDWTLSPNGDFQMKVTIPANVSARIFLPEVAMRATYMDGQMIPSGPVDLGSGTYTLTVR